MGQLGGALEEPLPLEEEQNEEGRRQGSHEELGEQKQHLQWGEEHAREDLALGSLAVVGVPVGPCWEEGACLFLGEVGEPSPCQGVGPVGAFLADALAALEEGVLDSCHQAYCEAALL